jgi:PAS domain S-box-containing protein
MKTKYKILLSLAAVITLVWIVEAAVHVIFFNKQSLFRELYILDTHELWMRLFTITVAAIMGIYIQSLLNTQKVAKIIKKSERRLRRIGEAMFEGIAITEDEKIIDANQQFAKMLEYEQSEIIGKSIMVFVAPESLNLVSQHIRENYMGVYEHAVLKKDGSIIDVEVRGRHKSNGDHMRREFVIRDITDRKLMEKKILEIEERERRRIGQDLHDGLGQLLSGIAFKCQALEDSLEKKSPADADSAASITSLADQAKEHARQLTRGLLPVEMEREGLMVALEELASNTKKLFEILCVFTCNKPVVINSETVVLHLYRIAQEAVSNAVRHGNAGHIEIALQKVQDNIVMVITDDGIGISNSVGHTNGMGLKIMNYRANIIGASLDIQLCSGGGTSVICMLNDIDIKQCLRNGDILTSGEIQSRVLEE